MDPSGSGALIALRSAAEGLRALGDTPQHRPQSPPRPPRGLWSGSDLFAFRPDVGSLRRSVPPTPGIPRGGACRAVPWGGGGRCVGLWRCSAPPAQPPPPSPMSHTVRRGGCPLCEDGRWTGEGARQPYRPHCVCVGQSRMGGMEGGGGTWGSQPQRGRGARARGLPLMSAARINNRRAAGTNSSSVPDPPGAPALLGQSPPPHSSLPSPSFLRRCPWGGQRIAGLAVWGRDAGCGMRPSGRSAQSSRAVPAQS